MQYSNKIHLPLFFFALVIAVCLFSIFMKGKEILLKESYDTYLAGEQADTISLRQRNFNRALNYYKELEEKYHPDDGNGKLFFNIANSYFQLGEYPWAILYYYRAQSLMPRADKVYRNLQIARSKLNLPPTENPSIFEKVFFLHNYFSLPERLQIFFIFALISFIFASLLIWIKKKWINVALFVTTVIACIMLISVCYTRYLSPVEGVIVSSTNLYRDAGTQYAKVMDEPVPSGSKVEVRGILFNGTWFKILTPEGHFGYVPNSSLQVI